MLEVRGLCKHFGGLAAVSGVDAVLARGCISAVIGPNGAGKTTFFNLISGAIPPSAGQVLFDGRDVTGLKADAMARLGVARTFQATNLFENASVLDNLIVGHRLRTRSNLWDALANSRRLRADERRCRAKAEAVLDFVGLGRIGHRLAADITQEERKRVAFALALATEPRLLLADEPAGGINDHETAGLAELMRKINASGVAVCLIEHKMGMVMGLADRILVLDHGARIAEGTPAEIRADPAVVAAYLGTDAEAPGGAAPLPGPLSPGPPTHPGTVHAAP